MNEATTDKRRFVAGFLPHRPKPKSKYVGHPLFEELRVILDVTRSGKSEATKHYSAVATRASCKLKRFLREHRD